MSYLEDDNTTDVKKYCSYCKLEIEIGEPCVVSGLNSYHIRENDKHDNCYQLMIEKE